MNLMTEAIIKFQEKINKRAIKYFENRPDVSLEEYHQFVNFKMGTEFQESYIEIFYQDFLKKRKENAISQNS
jgi:hypothetical protein